MTFFEARAVSRYGFFHVRRESWATGKWFIVWRGVWFHFDTGIFRIVAAADYSAADLLATDWTTVPGPLKSCPVIPPSGPGFPGSPGGVPPAPGFPPFPPPGPSGPPYGPGGGGGGGPTPPDSRGMSVTFSGLQFTQVTSGPRSIDDISGLNGSPIGLTKSGSNTWVGSTQVGAYAPDEPDLTAPIQWGIKATNWGSPHDTSLWVVECFVKSPHLPFSIGGFINNPEAPATAPIDNLEVSGLSHVGDGKATVGN